MKIEWASHFHSDGTRRRGGPPPSVMHGWLAKMRGTLLGDEDLRSKGMAEMRQARAYKNYQKSRNSAQPKPRIDRRNTGSSAIFGSLNPKPRPPPPRPVGRGTQTRHLSSRSGRVVGQPAPPPRRSSHPSYSHQSTNRRPAASGSRQSSSRPTPQRRQTGR